MPTRKTPGLNTGRERGRGMTSDSVFPCFSEFKLPSLPLNALMPRACNFIKQIRRAQQIKVLLSEICAEARTRPVLQKGKERISSETVACPGDCTAQSLALTPHMIRFISLTKMWHLTENHHSLANILYIVDQNYIINMYCQLHQIATK